MPELLFITVLGLCIGSFLNVLITRLPLRESVIGPRSRCFECQQTIAWYDLIPLASYAFLKGRCRQCNTRISLRYPSVESITAVCFMALYFRYGFTIEFVRYSILASTLLVAAEIDRMYRIIPNPLLAWSLTAGVLLTWMQDGMFFMEQLVSATAAGTALLAIRWLGLLLFNKPGMGMGDVKLAGVAGFYLEWDVFWGLYIAILLAGLFSIAGLLLGRLKRSSQVPFAPFLGLGAALWFCTRLFWSG